jgi:hypothetical protein
MRWAMVWLIVAGVLLEAGCAWIWVLSPRATAAYNAEYTRELFDRLPLVWKLVDGLLPDALSMADGGLGLAQPPAWSVGQTVAWLEAGLLLMSAGYLLGLWALGATGERAGRAVLAFALLFRLTMASLPGLFSTDIYSYVMYGRIAAVHGQNPYLRAPNEFAADPFLAWVFPFWRDQPSVYGPVWTDLSWWLSRLTGGLSNFDQVLAYRLTLIGCELLVLGLLWWLLGLRTHATSGRAGRTRAWAMYAWNPLVLFDLVGDTHNDILMLALLVSGLAILAGGGGARGEKWQVGAGAATSVRWLGALAAVTLGALAKFATGVVALLWSVAYASGPARLGRLLASWTVGLVLAAILWWPWLDTSQALRPFADAAGGRLVINSAPDLVALFVADDLLVPMGLPQATARLDTRSWMRVLTSAVYVAYLVWELSRLWAKATRGGQPALQAAIEAATRALLVLPLLVLTWVWSWYLSWSLVLAVLLGSKSRLARVVVAYTLVGLPVVVAHQYLNEDLSGGFVLLMALAPLGAAYSGSQRPTAHPQPVPAGER